MYSIGSIIKITDLNFKIKKSSNGYLDHSYKNGRPCLVIAEDLDYIYFLPIRSFNEKFYKDESCYLNKEINYSKSSMINLKHSYRKKISYQKELTTVSYKTYLELIKKYIVFQNAHQYDELFPEVAVLLEKEIEKETKKLNKRK